MKKLTGFLAMVAATLVAGVVGTFDVAHATPTTSPPTDPPRPDGSAGSNTAAAMVFLGVSVAVIVIGLGFALLYHHRLLKSVDGAVRAGSSVSGTDSPSYGGGSLSQDYGLDEVAFRVIGPNKAAVDQEVTFKTAEAPDTGAFAWIVDGVTAEPYNGTDAELTTTFKSAGTATITVKRGGVSAAKQVAVEAPASARGVTLPFAVRNWGRLVVVLAGLGIVASLMALDVISSEGGIGLLGALLGVGAASANQDPNATPDRPEQESE